MRPYAQPQRHNMRQNGVFFMPRKAADMCEGPLISRIILYTIPIILTGVLQLLFNAADLVVVGRYCGSVSGKVQVSLLRSELVKRSMVRDVMPAFFMRSVVE